MTARLTLAQLTALVRAGRVDPDCKIVARDALLELGYGPDRVEAALAPPAWHIQRC